MHRLYLSAIGTALGEAGPIDTLAELADQPDSLELLRRGGLRDYLRSPLTVDELIERSLAASLSATGVPPGDIGLLVCATESATAARPMASLLGAVCRRLGLVNAQAVGTWASGCGNFLSALRIAGLALRAGRTRHALVVTADVAYAGEARVLPPSLTVFSDGAASCLLSAGPTTAPGLSVGTVFQFANNELWGAAPLQRIQHMSAGIRAVCGQTLGQAGKAAADCKYLVMNNYTQNIQRLFAFAGGFHRTQVFNGLVAAHGHVGSADTLLNLQALSEGGELRGGDLLCLLSTGTNVCGAVSLEVAR